MTNFNPAAILAENVLLRLLMDLPPDTKPIMVQIRFNGFAATLRIGSPDAMGTAERTFKNSSGNALTTRQQEIYDVASLLIASGGHRATGSDIRTALRAAGVLWGVSTVNAALADLVAAGWLVNDNDKQGYGLPSERKPVLDRESGRD